MHFLHSLEEDTTRRFATCGNKTAYIGKGEQLAHITFVFFRQVNCWLSLAKCYRQANDTHSLLVLFTVDAARRDNLGVKIFRLNIPASFRSLLKTRW